MGGGAKNPLLSALSVAMVDHGIEARTPLKIGFLAPLSGSLRAWSEPGLFGCMIWRDRINAMGGLKIGMRRHMVEIIPFDTRYEPERVLQGIRSLIHEHNVKFILMNGGNDLTVEVRDVIAASRMLVACLLPSDLSPDVPTLIAPSELHPIYNVTGVDWLRRTAPHLKTVSLCGQNDLFGLPSVATYRAAFEVAGIDIVREEFFPVDTTDFEPIVARMLEPNPDILCWDTAYEPFVDALTRAAYRQGFRGQLLSCTCDNYHQLIRQTSPDFMEGFVFQFPDFDDPALADSQVNFENADAFYREYCERFPDTWSAVSWEYASTLELWRMAVQRARSAEPFSVLAMMKFGGVGHHAFGEAIWWGHELFGIDNALVGDWPVVRVEGGKARIKEMVSIRDWLTRHTDVLVRHLRAMNLMWDQRHALTVNGQKEFAQDDV